MTSPTNGMTDTNEIASTALTVTGPKDLKALTLLKKGGDRAKALAIADQIDPADPMSITSFATGPQQQMSKTTDPMLAMVRAKDSGEVGNLLTSLLGNTRELDPKILSKGGGRSLFGGNPRQKFLGRFDTVLDKIKLIEHQLEGHSRQLTQDVSQLRQLADANKQFYHELLIHIAGGEIKQAELEGLLKTKAAEAATRQDPLLNQEVSELRSVIDRLDRRLYDLRLSAFITLQTAPQIAMIMNADTSMIEKIQTTLSSTLTLWKNQMVMAVSMYNQKQGIEAQQAVDNATNALLLANAETLQQGQIAVATAMQRGIVDMDTLEKTHLMLISTVEETLKIQEQGKAQRAANEARIEQLTTQFSQKLGALQAGGAPVASLEAGANSDTDS